MFDFFASPFESSMSVMRKPVVRRILFTDPATIVFWDDGTKTVVKTTGDDKFVPYYGFLAALAKKVYGSNMRVQEMIRPWLPKEETEEQLSFAKWLDELGREPAKLEVKRCDNDCNDCGKCKKTKEEKTIEKADDDGDDMMDDFLNKLLAMMILADIKEKINEKIGKRSED